MKKLKNQAGSVLVFITLMIVVLMVMIGMGLDSGYISFSRGVAQRAVDMAALAGAAGGFVMGYYWHKVFVAGKREREPRDQG